MGNPKTETLRLSDEQIRGLRERHPYEKDLAWLTEFVQERGWAEANVRYLETERERAAGELRDLMTEAGIDRVHTTAEALDLIALACEVFVPEGGFSGTITRISDHIMRIEEPNCPVYREMESQDWHGVTACSGWYHRRGWLDALGVDAVDSVLRERKWGDPACVAVIDVRRVLAAT